MSVLASMYSGISGLNSNGTAMEIIGNNISNINTPSFKAMRAEFSDVLSKTLRQSYSVGRGSQVDSLSTIYEQGGFQTTANVLDLAIEGKGFFMVNDSENYRSFYTRAGNFHLDNNGFVVNNSGYRLQGYPVTQGGDKTGTPGDIQISSSLLQPKPTTEASFTVNLSSNADANPGGAWDADDPVNTSNFSSSLTVYDTLGNPHQLTVFYRLESVGATGNQWSWHVAAPADEWASPTPGATYMEGATGTLEFDTEGRLMNETTTANSFDFSGGAEPGQVINFDFGDNVTTEGGTGLEGSTQFGESSATMFQYQDGFGPAYLEALDVDTEGRIIGKYSNGEVRYFAQIAMVNFSNSNGLSRVGNNNYSKTNTSGSPIIATANTAGNGRIFANTLELSNVDLAEQFVNMITIQRGFQANSRSITTSDQMLNDLVNLVR